MTFDVEDAVASRELEVWRYGESKLILTEEIHYTDANGTWPGEKITVYKVILIHKGMVSDVYIYEGPHHEIAKDRFYETMSTIEGNYKPPTPEPEPPSREMLQHPLYGRF